MILKKILLAGFKSFCDATEFEFHSGVTCIVGPNGCGKSNVVDAVKWVLGTQSAKSLRGDQMMDMIFNGSSSRRSSGLAQVDLVFDNECGTLQLEQPEVTVTRRLHRSGDSEYLINGSACRLRDIRELFLDTGIGVDAYSVIEQGRVDVLLQSNPRERRLIFEEAAGISKYKARRREAERKLERTQQNLLRVQDIVDELERRLRSVKLQAGKARSFQEYDRRLRALRASFAFAEYKRLTDQEDHIGGQATRLTDHSVQLRADLSRLETQNSEIAARTLHLDQEIDQGVQRGAAIKSELTALDERAKAARQRRQELEETAAGHAQRRSQEGARLTRLEHDIAREQAQLPELQDACRAHTTRIAELSSQDQQLLARIAQLQATMEDEKSGLIDLLRRSADLHHQIVGLDTQRQNLTGQKHRLQARDGEVRQQLEQVLGRKAMAQQRLTEIATLIEHETSRLSEKQAAYAAAREQRGQTARQLGELKERRSGLVSQRDLLVDLERKMEGVDRTVRDLLQRKAADPHDRRLATIHGMVADLITTDSEHSPVIEAALERWAQHLVVRDTEGFLSLNGDLNLKGRLHLFCADRLSPVIDRKIFSGREGFVGHALELVRFPENLEYLVRHILGRTIVVERFEHALALAAEDVDGCEFVTLKGETVDGHGRMTIGPKSEQTGLIARKSRVRQLAGELTDVDSRIGRLTDALNQEDVQCTHLETLLHDLRTAIHENQTARVETEGVLQHALEEIERLTHEQPVIAGEVDNIEREIARAIEQGSQSQETLTELKAQNDRRQATVDSYRQRIATLQGERTQLMENLTQARVAAGTLTEKQSALQDTLQALHATLESARSSVADHEHNIEICRERMVESDQVAAECTQRFEGCTRQLVEHDKHILDLRRQREGLRHDSEQVSAETKSARTRLSETDEQLHGLQLRRQEVVVRRDELCARIREELAIDLVHEFRGDQHTQQDWEAVEAEIRDLREKISRLGNINLDAIQEQDDLQERLGFLTRQQQDLEDSRRQLAELIEQLNAESRDRFTATFAGIRAHFQEMFRKLFGGGKADLVLDPTCEDVLEAGVDILARPPGKELQSISLMSGGEKTMTAIALLLSIFKTKPSPFVLLDEVDAALDEANNERFNTIIREFLDQSQFIVITHSKRTMHIADVLYGVTMQEAGVSRRVSVHFEEQAKPKSAVA